MRRTITQGKALPAWRLWAKYVALGASAVYEGHLASHIGYGGTEE